MEGSRQAIRAQSCLPDPDMSVLLRRLRLTNLVCTPSLLPPTTSAPPLQANLKAQEAETQRFMAIASNTFTAVRMVKFGLGVSYFSLRWDQGGLLISLGWDPGRGVALQPLPHRPFLHPHGHCPIPRHLSGTVITISYSLGAQYPAPHWR